MEELWTREHKSIVIDHLNSLALAAKAIGRRDDECGCEKRGNWNCGSKNVSVRQGIHFIFVELTLDSVRK